MRGIRSILSRLGLRSDSPSSQLKALYSTQAVLELDPQGHILFANAQFLDLMGYELDELRGQHHRIFLDPADAQARDYRDFWARLARGQAFVGRCRRIDRQGREVWLQANYSPCSTAVDRCCGSSSTPWISRPKCCAMPKPAASWRR